MNVLERSYPDGQRSGRFYRPSPQRRDQLERRWRPWVAHVFDTHEPRHHRVSGPWPGGTGPGRWRGRSSLTQVPDEPPAPAAEDHHCADQDQQVSHPFRGAMRGEDPAAAVQGRHDTAGLKSRYVLGRDVLDGRTVVGWREGAYPVTRTPALVVLHGGERTVRAVAMRGADRGRQVGGALHDGEDQEERERPAPNAPGSPQRAPGSH